MMRDYDTAIIDRHAQVELMKLLDNVDDADARRNISRLYRYCCIVKSSIRTGHLKPDAAQRKLAKVFQTTLARSTPAYYLKVSEALRLGLSFPDRIVAYLDATDN